MKKNSIKFNVIDTAILIFVVSILVCAYFSVNNRIITLLNHKSQNAVITIVADVDVYDNLSYNDNVLFSKTDKEFGKVLSVFKRKKYDYIPDENGTIIRQVSNDNFECVVRIKTTVKKNEEGVFVNSGNFCATGSTFDLISGKNFFSGTVENIKID